MKTKIEIELPDNYGEALHEYKRSCAMLAHPNRELVFKSSLYAKAIAETIIEQVAEKYNLTNKDQHDFAAAGLQDLGIFLLEGEYLFAPKDSNEVRGLKEVV